MESQSSFNIVFFPLGQVKPPWRSVVCLLLLLLFCDTLEYTMLGSEPLFLSRPLVVTADGEILFQLCRSTEIIRPLSNMTIDQVIFSHIMIEFVVVYCWSVRH